MKITIERKCNACKNAIQIKRNNVQGVVYYKKFYYHTTCFCEFAENKAKLKTGKPAEWQDALEHIDEFEKHASELLSINNVKPKRETDDLNDYLLEHYNVSAISNSNFWRTVMELQKGIYKGKRCKKVPINILLEAWKWGQKKLNEVDKRNKMNHKGPENDLQRISYDLAILVNKIPDYLAYKAKQEAAEAERKIKCKETINIDYSKIKTVNNTSGLDDISDLLDDII